MSVPNTPAPGWHSDPAGGTYQRYWDGQQWTGNTRPFPAGAQTPYTPPPQAPEGAPDYGYAAGGYPQGAYSPGGYGYATPPIGVYRSPIDTRPVVNDMFEAVRVFLAKYAQFDGRAGRPEFWYTALAYFIVVFALGMTILIPFFALVIFPVYWALSLGTLVPVLAMSVRRLRDAGFHWAWMFLLLVPPGFIALIVMWAMPSRYP